MPQDLITPTYTNAANYATAQSILTPVSDMSDAIDLIDLMDAADQSGYMLGVPMTSGQASAFANGVDAFASAWSVLYGSVPPHLSKTITLARQGKYLKEWRGLRYGLSERVFELAPTITVENLDDDGADSLRDLIENISGPRVIQNNAGIGCLPVMSPLLFEAPFIKVVGTGLTLTNGVENLRPQIGTARGHGNAIHDIVLQNFSIRPMSGVGETNPSRGLEWRCGHHIQMRNQSLSGTSDESLRAMLNPNPADAASDVLYEIVGSYLWPWGVTDEYVHSTGVLNGGQDYPGEDPPIMGNLLPHSIYFMYCIFGPQITHRLPHMGGVRGALLANSVTTDYASKGIQFGESCIIDVRNNLVIMHATSAADANARFESHEQWQIDIDAPAPSILMDGNRAFKSNWSEQPFTLAWFDKVTQEDVEDDPLLYFGRREPLTPMEFMPADQGLLLHLLEYTGAFYEGGTRPAVDEEMLTRVYYPQGDYPQVYGDLTEPCE